MGNRTNIVDARGNPLGFVYNGLNRLTNIVYAPSDLERFAYDPVGNLTNYTARSGDKIKFIYDPANRLTNKTYVGASDVMTFGYDPANRLTNALWKVSSTTNSHVTFQYDPAGRLTNESQKISTVAAKSVRYEYDTAGRKTKMTYPDGSYIRYGYNANGWLTGISNSDNSVIVIYEYDNAGRRTKRTLENSTFTVYDYDNVNQVTGITHKKGDQTMISRYEYGYDDAGQRKYVKRANTKGDVYKYDATDQLTNVLYEVSDPDTTPSGGTNDVRYLFDAAGNRSSMVTSNSAGQSTTSYTANALNQYTDVGGAGLGYDDNGNLFFDGSTLYYWYDRENRLIEAATGNLSTDVFYTYDAFNRLIARLKDTSATRFYYDSEWRVIAEYDENDSLKAKYVYGPEIDEPVRMNRNGNNYYYHSAALGTVTEITLANQTVAERYTYDAYGAPTIFDSQSSILSASAIGNRFLFQGRDRDPDTGIYNFRNRYYSPSLGRFMQVDPVWGRGGLNLYSFVRNNPVRSFDPYGLEPEDEQQSLGDCWTDCMNKMVPWPLKILGCFSGLGALAAKIAAATTVAEVLLILPVWASASGVGCFIGCMMQTYPLPDDWPPVGFP